MYTEDTIRLVLDKLYFSPRSPHSLFSRFSDFSHAFAAYRVTPRETIISVRVSHTFAFARVRSSSEKSGPSAWRPQSPLILRRHRRRRWNPIKFIIGTELAQRTISKTDFWRPNWLQRKDYKLRAIECDKQSWCWVSWCCLHARSYGRGAMTTGKRLNLILYSSSLMRLKFLLFFIIIFFFFPPPDERRKYYTNGRSAAVDGRE